MTPGWGSAPTTGPSGTSFVIVSPEPAGMSAAAEAIALIGGTVAAQVPLDMVPGVLLAPDGAAVVVVLDLAGAQDDAAHAAVVALDALAAARAWPLIVAMRVAQIDLVVAAVAHSDAQLLCTPDQGEWISALAVASAGNAGGGHVRDPDSETERLAWMTAEVARIAELLARLGRPEEGGGRAADRRPGFAPAPVVADISPGAVRDVIRARRLRDRFLGDGLFEDPAWDILLDLFAAQLEKAHVSVSSLCIAAAVAPTTALRWITRLTAVGLLRRAPDPNDGRRAFVGLSDTALGAMHRYMAALSEAGLPLV